MKIASWNVNSIHVRLPQVLTWLSSNHIDVLAIQETKVTDASFPIEAFNDIAYNVTYTGQDTYNGVALISKHPQHEVCKDNPYFQDAARRFMVSTVNDIRIVNLYAPNGQSIDSEKYLYKLAWFKGVTAYLKNELKKYPKLVVLGDLNVAPADLDVHAPETWKGHVLVSEREREAFQALLKLGLNDTLRHTSSESGIYTWWDYRQGAFRRNLGLRIDHILVSDPLLQSIDSVNIDKIARKAERPSDHAPLWIEIK